MEMRIFENRLTDRCHNFSFSKSSSCFLIKSIRLFS